VPIHLDDPLGIVLLVTMHTNMGTLTAAEFNEIQSTKRNTYRRKVAAAKKGVPYVETAGPLREPRVPEATGPPGTTFIEDPAAAAGIDTSRSIKKQRMSAAAAASSTGEDSAMAGVDADTTQEYQDAESESDHVDEDDEDDAGDDVEEEEEEEDDDEEGAQDDDEMQDALEEREDQNGEDEALDNGEDSDS
jgi:DNA polymerase epsilon subunit 3